MQLEQLGRMDASISGTEEIDLEPEWSTAGSTAVNCHGRSRWQPGINAKGILDRGHRLEQQTAALLINGYNSLKRLPIGHRRQMAEWCPAVGMTDRTTLNARVLSGIMRVPARTIENIAQDSKGLLRNADIPTSQPKNSFPEVQAEGVVPVVPVVSVASVLDPGLMTITRLALANAVRGRPFSNFPEDCRLLALSRADVGVVHHTRHFARAVELTAGDEVQKLLRADVDSVMGALGIPSDIELIMDGGTVGQYRSRARDSMLLVGVGAGTNLFPVASLYTCNMIWLFTSGHVSHCHASR
jgi:hypothetical protein